MSCTLSLEHDLVVTSDPGVDVVIDTAGEGRTYAEKTFHRLLLNTLVSSVTSSFLWFSLTFWVYLETRSVVATGVIGGSFALSSAALGPYFGAFVDRHRKHHAMMVTTSLSLMCFAVATMVFFAVPASSLLSLTHPAFWVLVGATLLGSVAGNMRGIALSTCVTLLVPESRRDKANGLVGTVTGLSFAITSVFSGLVIGGPGMGWAYFGSVVVVTAMLLHLRSISIDEAAPVADQADGAPTGHIDIRAAVDAIRAVPGLGMLIGLAAFNNLLAGVFMALTDAYGLSMVSVEAWGLLFGFISVAFIIGGIAVAKFGLGNNALRLVLVCNLINWSVCSVFAVQSSIVLLTIGMVVWLGLMPVVEAAEQTVLQRSIPFERQGRVFGFAQMIENAAAPLTAFLMAPLAEQVFMPLMTDGRGADLIGSWFGIGPDRGIAVMFTLAGLTGVVVTIAALRSKSYRRLAHAM